MQKKGATGRENAQGARGKREMAVITSKFWDWERVALAKIWLTRALVLGELKNWARDWTTVGALVFSFLPKTSFWECFLGTLGDALRTLFIIN